MRHTLFILFILVASELQGIDYECLRETLAYKTPAFSYPIDIKSFKGKSSNENVLVCCHGYGSDNSLGDIIHQSKVSPCHIVSFNFPDYNIYSRGFDPKTTCYGTPYEILPALALLKTLAVDANADTISLYGFSAGGGAVVNILAALNTDKFDALLPQWGIALDDKPAILKALQKGVILLDAPLKSKEEIAEVTGTSRPGNDLLTQYYRNNGMRPIDALAAWQGLNLNVILFFQNPDASLTNRDDTLFAERLRQYNPKGRNTVIIKDEGGHCGFHTSLWKAYQSFILQPDCLSPNKAAHSTAQP